MLRGKLFVISAPSGTGKTTIVQRLVHAVPNLRMSLSYTSRDQRSGECDGRDYHFVSQDRFNEMVSSGEWKDYGLSILKKEVSFNVYRRTSEFPAYKITKNLKPKNENEKYLIKDAQNKIINSSESLQNLIKKIIWKKFKLVN